MTGQVRLAVDSVERLDVTDFDLLFRFSIIGCRVLGEWLMD
jgi:hypothetical protein